MAAVVGGWCGVNAKYLIYVRAPSTTQEITNVVRKCRRVDNVLNCHRAQSSRFFRWKKGPLLWEYVTRVQNRRDMVHKNKAYGTDSGVHEEEGFDSSLKSDTAQRIIQQWIEVWSSDISVSFQQPCELWRFCLWYCSGLPPNLPALIHFDIFNFIQEATGLSFSSSRFIESLQDGVLLC